ncbi:MAG TPA: aconitate hydratase AcnA [Polyangiaceae bacterium]|nr:aconitate hydratase AcnA [Polyangiaceae bacterium]
MDKKSLDSFEVRTVLELGARQLHYYSLPRFAEQSGCDISRLPYSLKILLENLLRNEDGVAVKRDDVLALAHWDPQAKPITEIALHPARVVLQDFTGVPAVVDLAAMRDAVAALGGDATRINPLFPSELVIDHSVQVDAYGSSQALSINANLEFHRNRERYQLLRWAQTAFDSFRVVPPDTGIVHQVNLEYLARVVFERDGVAYPDSLVGTDSHTTMINGLGVLGWGVGGIEAEAAMLGQPINLLVPNVVGFRLHGQLPAGSTATDLVLTVTKRLRQAGVVEKFVEFFGAGLASLSLADRATIANMSPEFGSTVAIFPIDAETLAYLRFTGRPPEQVELVEAYAKAQGLFVTPETPDPKYSQVLDLDLGTVRPSLAGPKRPQDLVLLSDMKHAWADALKGFLGAAKKRESTPKPAAESRSAEERATDPAPRDADFYLGHGAVVIAAITSCTNTSNPSVMMGAGLLAKKARERGLRSKPWVKTSLAPGSLVVSEYLKAAGLMPELEALGFHLVGYGCTTCIGNSGPLPEPVVRAINAGDLVVASVLSGNRTVEGRINPHVRANYLASPPLVVAHAIAGRVGMDFEREPLGNDPEGNPVYLRDIWPSPAEVSEAVRRALSSTMFHESYSRVFDGDAAWQGLQVPEGARFEWDPGSTYVRKPTFFSDLPREPRPLEDIQGARVLCLLGDSVTTDHISPAGSIAPDSPAARYLLEHSVAREDFNSYGARRGNHEVMVRGTFANVRLQNQLAPGTEGGFTRHQPSGEQMSIFDASQRYAREDVPLLVIAGKEYGSGSSRDWAAKGTLMLGVKAVLARSYERIHRSNLIGMGVLPLEFLPGQDSESLGLTGRECYSISGIAEELATGKHLTVRAISEDGAEREFEVLTRIDTAVELEYYRHGGILQYVLRQLLHDNANAAAVSGVAAAS